METIHLFNLKLTLFHFLYQARIILSDVVSVDEFMSSEKDKVTPEVDPGKVYSISSLVYHIGARASSGHYTADAIRTDESGKDEWVSFDDSQTSKKSRDKVLTSLLSERTAYMLLYTLD